MVPSSAIPYAMAQDLLSHQADPPATPRAAPSHQAPAWHGPCPGQAKGLPQGGCCQGLYHLPPLQAMLLPASNTECAPGGDRGGQPGADADPRDPVCGLPSMGAGPVTSFQVSHQPPSSSPEHTASWTPAQMSGASHTRVLPQPQSMEALHQDKVATLSTTAPCWLGWGSQGWGARFLQVWEGALPGSKGSLPCCPPLYTTAPGTTLWDVLALCPAPTQDLCLLPGRKGALLPTWNRHQHPGLPS